MLSTSVHCYGEVDTYRVAGTSGVICVSSCVCSNHLTYISFNKYVIVGFTYKQYADTRSQQCGKKNVYYVSICITEAVFDRKFTSGNLKERHHLRDLDVNGILILTGILGKCGMGKQLLCLTPTEVTIKINLFWHVTPCFSNICLPDYTTSHLKTAIIFITEYISSTTAFLKHGNET
jgi:hypothetical protein